VNRGGFVHEFPGPTTSFTRYLWDCEEVDAARSVVAALDALAPVIRPLAIDLEIACCDRELYLADWCVAPELPYWQLRAAAPPPDVIVASRHSGAVTREATELTADQILSWIGEALGQRCPLPDTHTLCITGLAVTACCAWLAAASDAPAESVLPVVWDNGILEPPVVRDAIGAWVAGPVPPLPSQPPVEVSISKEGGEAVLHVTTHWSLWTAAGHDPAGRLRQAFGKIVAQGWKP
jgi:hypothetical protein